ncbi:MAG: hypothetical protein EA383_14965 [Spirochaetaceae bacterium]|nr:MAG: hypothetical protein EA383_14965 [Spirochaetaceae bacterium]
MSTQIIKICNTLIAALTQDQSLPAKQVGRARYYHLFSCVDPSITDALSSELAQSYGHSIEASDLVLKRRGDHVCSLLVYADFLHTPHPTLKLSMEVDTLTGRFKSRRYRANRPVLHRKELLLRTDSPEYEPCATLTAAEVRAGLLSRPYTFGFEKQWENRLVAAGFRVDGHTLSPCER